MQSDKLRCIQFGDCLHILRKYAILNYFKSKKTNYMNHMKRRKQPRVLWKRRIVDGFLGNHTRDTRETHRQCVSSTSSANIMDVCARRIHKHKGQGGNKGRRRGQTQSASSSAHLASSSPGPSSSSSSSPTPPSGPCPWACRRGRLTCEPSVICNRSNDVITIRSIPKCTQKWCTA